MKFDVVRAWKDEAYRQSLSEEQLSALPANPAGELELTDDDLASVYGGGSDEYGHGPVIVRTVTIVKKEYIKEYIHSVSIVVCDINIYSIQITAPLLPLKSPILEICEKRG